jgi:hypothetical protein
MMHSLTCPVCNPLAKRRRRRFVARVLADGHIEFMHLLAERSRTERRQRRVAITEAAGGTA